MKQGRTLTQLAQVVDQQSKAKRDFIAHTPAVSFVATDGGLRMALNETGTYEMTEHFHDQVGETLGIPARFYDRMLKDHPDVLAYDVNELLRREPKRRMVRTLGDKARAFLSDSYRPLDNFDLMNVIMPQFAESELDVLSCEVTDTRLYIKGISHKMTGEVKKGDVVESGVLISNSEIGMGALRIEPFINRLECTNGMVINKLANRKTHVGRRNMGGYEALVAEYEFISNETRKLEDTAYWHKVRDVVHGMLGEGIFRNILDDFKVAAGLPITGSLQGVVEVTGKYFQLREKEQESVLRHLIAGGELSKWGLANAITRTAEDVESYDRATDLEEIGGRVIELDRSEWQDLSTD